MSGDFANTANVPSSTSCALGPHSVGTLDAGHLCTAHFSSATIYFPEGAANLPSLVIVGGWGDGEKVLAAWGPFYASHGIVAMTIGTPSPWKDFPQNRCQALLAASSALQSENIRADSPLQGRLDESRRAVQGYSLGGGGAQLAAKNDQTLRCAIALCPNDGRDFGPPIPTELSVSVPVLIICGEKDTDAPPKDHASVQYRNISAPRLIFEVAGGDHYVANGPAGGIEAAGDDCGELCNCTAIICLAQCVSRERMCVPCPSAVRTVPTGEATDSSPRGAIAGVALAWLQLFLFGDEGARSKLAARPDIATCFESSGVEAAPAMQVM